MKSFTISNRTRKGCPLSLCFFNLMIEPLVEAIRSHLDITGFYFHNSVNLFEDDTILLLTNPESSLPLVFQILSQFSCISYYKVNASKALILDLAVQASTKLTLQCQFPIAWNTEGILYLGITLTTFPTSLAADHFKPLISKIEKELQRLETFEISWCGRLSAVKILPFSFQYFYSESTKSKFSIVTESNCSLLKWRWFVYSTKEYILILNLYHHSHIRLV